MELRYQSRFIGGGLFGTKPLPPPQPPTQITFAINPTHVEHCFHFEPSPAVLIHLLLQLHSNRFTSGHRKAGHQRIFAWGVVPPSTMRQFAPLTFELNDRFGNARGRAEQFQGWCLKRDSHPPRQQYNLGPGITKQIYLNTISKGGNQTKRW